MGNLNKPITWAGAAATPAAQKHRSAENRKVATP